jgi:acyl-CoA thioester hydrolase
MICNYSHATKVRVRYGETDQMGYCYYGNYATYFEVGRVEALRALNLSYKQLEFDGIMLPVSHFEIDYLSPAFYDDELIIETTIVEVKGPRIFFEYVITNEKNVQVCVGKTTLVFVNKATMRPIPPTKDFLNLIEQYEKKDELL